MITHKDGTVVAMVPLQTLEMISKIELHKYFAFAYAQTPKSEHELDEIRDHITKNVDVKLAIQTQSS